MLSDTGGELISNTLYFELKYGWTGLLVEPNPDELRELYSKHRKSTITIFMLTRSGVAITIFMRTQLTRTSHHYIYAQKISQE